MKIANVYDMIYPYIKGGVEKRNWELAHRLAARNHEVHLFGMQFWDGPDFMEREGVYLHGVCKPGRLFINGRRSIGTAGYFALKVLPYLVKERFDIIDCQNAPYFPCISVKLGSSLRNYRFIITWHEFWGDYWYEYLGRRGFFGKVIEKIAARLPDGIISVSEGTKRNLINAGVNKQIRVIPSGLDIKGIDRVVKAETETDLIYVGRLIKEKNADLLIRAVKLLKQDVPGIRCLIIGEGPEGDRLKALSRELDVENNITFTGILEDYNDVIARMKSAGIFMLPSVREGLGLIVLEANACGLPVVTTEHPMNLACDLIGNGNGLTCQLSPEAIADAAIKALKQRHDMKTACIDNAAKYNWDDICTEVESYYRDLVY